MQMVAPHPLARSKHRLHLLATISVLFFFTQLEYLTRTIGSPRSGTAGANQTEGSGISASSIKAARRGLNLTTGESSGSGNKDRSIKVYKPTTDGSPNVAVCLAVKNETLYIDEHLDYHIALGFSPIYIYDNSLDFELNNSHAVFDSFTGANTSWYQSRKDIHQYIRLIHFPQSPVQIPAYDQCIKRDAKDSTFVALIDVDEFVVLKRHSNVVDFVEAYCDFRCGQLSINWQNMGTSGETNYSAVPVLKRNVHYDENRAMHGTIKVIVRVKAVADPMRWRHSVMLKDKYNWVDTNHKVHKYKFGDWRRQSNNDKPLDVAVIYHYPFKSREEFRYRTCVRGTSAHKRGEVPMCDNPGYYELYNGTTFDDTAWRHLMRMVPKYRDYERN